MDIRATLRRFASWIFVGVILVIIISVASEWFIHVADDKGWYKNAGSTWDRAVSAVFAFVTQPLVIGSVSMLGGFVLGMWVDAWLVRREKERGFGEPEITDINLEDLASGMLDFVEKVSEVKDQRKREFDAKNEGNPSEEMSQHRWFADYNFHYETGYRLKRRFGHDLAYYLGVLEELGVKTPDHLRFEGNRNGIEVFMGTMARFIKKGHLDKAVSLSHDDQKMFRLVNEF